MILHTGLLVECAGFTHLDFGGLEFCKVND